MTEQDLEVALSGDIAAVMRVVTRYYILKSENRALRAELALEQRLSFRQQVAALEAELAAQRYCPMCGCGTTSGERDD
jgi:hypothetical protein